MRIDFLRRIFMAKRPAWHIDNQFRVVSETFEFKWNSGFAISQSRKNIHNLHKSIMVKYPDAKPFEISSKSEDSLGQSFSAHNLKLDGYFIENIFQASKVFKGNIQYLKLLDLPPNKVKSELRKLSDEVPKDIVGFKYNGIEFSTTPISAFYDYLYIKALLVSNLDLDKVIIYDWFTDIAFNPKKSINCQARSMALYKSLRLTNNLDLVNSKDAFFDYHKMYVKY